MGISNFFQKSQLWFYAYLSNIWWYLRPPITPISRSLKIINFGRFFGIIPNWESWVWVTKVAYSVSRLYDFYKIMVILLVKSSNIKNPQILAQLNLPCKKFKTFYHSKIASLPTEILYWSWKMSKKSNSYIFIWWLNGRFLNEKCSQWNDYFLMSETLQPPFPLSKNISISQPPTPLRCWHNLWKAPTHCSDLELY